MFGILWSLIKSARYLLPFLNEVTDENDKNISSEDLLRIQQLKKMLSLAIWRIIYLVIVVSVVYWGVIPLHTENAVLKQELSERDKRIITINEEFRQARNEIRRMNESLLIHTNDLKTITADRDRLIKLVHECRVAESQYRDYVTGKVNTTENIPATRKEIEAKAKSVNKDNNNNNTTTKKTISDTLRAKILMSN